MKENPRKESGGRRWGFEFKCSEEPRSSRSMHVALADLKLDRLWIVYPGTLRYPIAERMTALPLREWGTLAL